MPQGYVKLAHYNARVCVMWDADRVSPPCCGSLLAWNRGLPPPLPQRPHLCSAVPWLLAFLPRPLSNSGGEADGPGFLCTNQGGICSLTDTSPLTQVSSHIHYSSSVRWAAVRVHNRAEDEPARRGGGDAGWGDEHLSPLFQLQNSFVFQESVRFWYRQWTLEVAFCQTHCV